MPEKTPAIEEGKPAPDFTLPTVGNRKVSLKDFRGKKVVLYFYPKDNTPGCTREACGFRDSTEELRAAGAVVLGVSLDGPASHKRFAGKYSLPFPLLSDEKAEVSKLYDVYRQKSLYGRKFWGIERSPFIIDEAGIIRKIFRKVKVDSHIPEVFQALTS
ncbi:MAG: thioredoxin-dependent thiol peroxidase [Candidatus Bathyarchaeia archaeon]